jgi:D-tyrosyl-tRNA(Tyr) deacylase
MRAVVQRVSQAYVTVDGEEIGRIGPGLLVLLGVQNGDAEKEASYLADKIAGLRIFEDTQGKMNLSLLETGGSMLIVSQFTLLGDCRKGRRPSFTDAAPPAEADALYRRFCELVRQKNILVATGKFQADMQVTLTNSGPVTMLLESPRDNNASKP